jgi:hypothetical protein
MCAIMVQCMCAFVKLTCTCLPMLMCGGRCSSRDSIDGCFECYDYEIARSWIWCGHCEYLCCRCLLSYLQFLSIDRCPRANSSKCHFPKAAPLAAGEWMVPSVALVAIAPVPSVALALRSLWITRRLAWCMTLVLLLVASSDSSIMSTK